MPRWVKGQSGNPKGVGRKTGPVERTIKARAERHANKALKALTDVLKDKEAPHAAKVSAANSLLDRAYGRAPQDVTVKGKIEQHIIELIRGLDSPVHPDSDTPGPDDTTEPEHLGEYPTTTH